MNKVIRIGTRESRLAVVQTELVARAIEEYDPDLRTELVTMKTTGDKILDKTLDKIGGKGLFIKELHAALQRGEVDICAHSYKDMPAEEDELLPVVAVSPREDPRDVLILPEGVSEPDPEKPIGCASQRRQIQIKELYPDHHVKPVRGNILTRLQKLDSGEYGALVLAAAGVKRLDLWGRVNRAFAPEELLPAGCQGIIAVQGRRGEDHTYLSGYHNLDAWYASSAERAYICALECGCGAPVGVYGVVEGGQLWLRGMLANSEGTYREEISGPCSEAKELGTVLAQKILERSGGLCRV